MKVKTNFMVRQSTVCPDCGAPLFYNYARKTVVCDNCGQEWDNYRGLQLADIDSEFDLINRVELWE